MDGEENSNFVLEVDNVTQIMDYQNCIMSPLIDDQGKLKGAV